MISSPFANSNVDLPALPPEAYAIIHDENVYAVCDVGGDDRGAYALGRYRDGIMKGDYEMLMVVNMLKHALIQLVEIMNTFHHSLIMIYQHFQKVQQ
jgi:hypothetical protein